MRLGLRVFFPNCSLSNFRYSATSRFCGILRGFDREILGLIFAITGFRVLLPIAELWSIFSFIDRLENCSLVCGWTQLDPSVLRGCR